MLRLGEMAIFSELIGNPSVLSFAFSLRLVGELRDFDSFSNWTSGSDSFSAFPSLWAFGKGGKSESTRILDLGSLISAGLSLARGQVGSLTGNLGRSTRGLLGGAGDPGSETVKRLGSVGGFGGSLQAGMNGSGR